MFTQKYTTTEKIAAQSSLKPEEQTEKLKIVVSNDSFLQAEMLTDLVNKLEHLRLSNIK